MKAVKLKRHWLSKAEPKYWGPRSLWRVRAMREGKRYQWLLKAGKGDPSATGAAKAHAEWTAIRADIIGAENAHADGLGLVGFPTADDEQRYALAVQGRAAAEADIIEATITPEEWAQFQEWRRLKAEAAAANPTTPARPMLQQFRDLTAIFKAALDGRLSATKEGMKLKGNISASRHTQYGFALKHVDEVVGDTPIEPSGEYQITAAALATIFATYRAKCETIMAAEGYGGHWFNERMKTARMLATYLHQHGLLDALPSNIERLTEKYQIEAKPKPIPLDVLRAIWAEADERFRGFMLLALNCGFRQTEIADLERRHVRTIGGRVCVEKRRGKTGVPLAIPLWEPTRRFIDACGAAEGRLFGFDDGSHKSAMDALYHRMRKLRIRVAKAIPTATAYSFENFRDTGASFIDGINPMLTPLYLGHTDSRNAKWYVGDIGVPRDLDAALSRFETYLVLPMGSGSK